jgi:Disulphide bond corrector protein DsbC
MKKVLFLIIALTISIGTFAQIEHPVKWAYAAKRLNNTEAIVFLKATIQDRWHIYSMNGKEGGPVKTSFIFSPSKDYKLSGKTVEPTPKSKFEKSFGFNIGYFEKEVVFQQKIRLNSPEATVVKGKLEYMTCNDIHCNPPEDIDFTIPLGK